MKKYFLLSVLILIIAACSKKEEKFELFSCESFAYGLDSGNEVNASVRVKGFEQKEDNDKFYAKLTYTVDLQTADGRMIYKIDSGVLEKTASERMMDQQINSQIQLDKTYIKGTYKIFINVVDELSGKKSVQWSYFELSE
jgi:hypothetical protein